MLFPWFNMGTLTFFLYIILVSSHSVESSSFIVRKLRQCDQNNSEKLNGNLVCMGKYKDLYSAAVVSSHFKLPILSCFPFTVHRSGLIFLLLNTKEFLKAKVALCQIHLTYHFECSNYHSCKKNPAYFIAAGEGRVWRSAGYPGGNRGCKGNLPSIPRPTGFSYSEHFEATYWLCSII